MLHVYYRWIRWGISVRRDAGRTEPYVGGYMQSWDNLYIAHFMRERERKRQRERWEGERGKYDACCACMHTCYEHERI